MKIIIITNSDSGIIPNKSPLPINKNPSSSENINWASLIHFVAAAHCKRPLNIINVPKVAIKDGIPTTADKIPLTDPTIKPNFLPITLINLEAITAPIAIPSTEIDIGKVDPEYLFEVLSQMDMKEADALFVSCTALPVLQIIDRLEKKLNKPVLSSNQALIWDTLENIGKNVSINGFGKLFLTN